MDNFEKALSFTLKWEGFISDDPNDPGGLTIWGISSKSHKEIVLEMHRLIKNGRKDDAFLLCKGVYRETYWKKMECDKFPFPLNLILFDTAVNMGRSRAKEFYSSSSDWRDYLLKRIAFYSKLKTAKLYIRGWINRIVDLYEMVR